MCSYTDSLQGTIKSEKENSITNTHTQIIPMERKSKTHRLQQSTTIPREATTSRTTVIKTDLLFDRLTLNKSFLETPCRKWEYISLAFKKIESVSETSLNPQSRPRSRPQSRNILLPVDAKKNAVPE